VRIPSCALAAKFVHGACHRTWQHLHYIAACQICTSIHLEDSREFQKWGPDLRLGATLGGWECTVELDYHHCLIFTKLGETTDADKVMNPLHFGSDAADIRNPGLRFLLVIRSNYRLTTHLSATTSNQPASDQPTNITTRSIDYHYVSEAHKNDDCLTFQGQHELDGVLTVRGWWRGLMTTARCRPVHVLLDSFCASTAIVDSY